MHNAINTSRDKCHHDKAVTSSSVALSHWRNLWKKLQIQLFEVKIYFICICVCVLINECHIGDLGVQNMTLDSPKLQLHVIMSSGPPQECIVFICRTISPAYVVNKSEMTIKSNSWYNFNSENLFQKSLGQVLNLGSFQPLNSGTTEWMEILSTHRHLQCIVHSVLCICNKTLFLHPSVLSRIGHYGDLGQFW